MATAPKPTTRQQRAEARAEQVEAFRKREAASRRNRTIGLVLSIVGILVVIGVVATVIVINVINAIPKPIDPQVIGGVQTFDDLEAGHTEGSVEYEQTPPVGGNHNPGWLNCGVYDEPQANEYAVHSLEHGAVWITYDPESASAAQIEALRELGRAPYTIVSPYPGIGEAFAISAWGAQLRFADVGDPALEAFIEQYRQSSSAPEPGAPCTGAVDGPGLVR